jgi:hypothetical protein
MVDNPLSPDLLLIVLLWLGGFLYKRWARNRSATGQTPGKPATLLPKYSRDPKPFAGLTHKPRCAACEQAPEPGSPAPRVSHQRCFPPPRDGRARWRPRSTSVPSRTVLIMAGWDWGISGPMVIPAVVGGASSSVGVAGSTF